MISVSDRVIKRYAQKVKFQVFFRKTEASLSYPENLFSFHLLTEKLSNFDELWTMDASINIKASF